MKFGIREICDVVFKAKADMRIGATEFKKGQPVLYIDSAKTSTIEGAATTVYATGGRGNSRLIAWEGEKTLTFTVEDALLSPIGFAVLSGAGLFKDTNADAEVHVHMTSEAFVSTSGEIDLTEVLGEDSIDGTAPVFVVAVEEDGSLTGSVIEGLAVEAGGKKITGATSAANKNVFVDFYVTKASAKVSELQIDAENFAGSYYVEASTLFRKEIDGTDMPAEITIPNVKIQSNFTFAMASSGDPSTFTFTMDAFPGYTNFNKTKKVLCAIQVIDENASAAAAGGTVMGHVDAEKDESEDSVVPAT